MMADIDMTKLMANELRKVRDYPRFKFNTFVFANEVTMARKRLKLSGIRFYTRPKYANNTLIGYNIYTQD